MVRLADVDKLQQQARRQNRNGERGLSLVELIVAIAIVAILTALVVPAVQQAREAARRTECLNRFRQVGIALHEYHASHDTFPPGSIFWGGECGMQRVNAGFGWSAFILPYLEHRSLYSRIDFDLGAVSANGASNFQVGGTQAAVFTCPSDPQAGVFVDCCTGMTNGLAPGDDWRASNMAGVADSRDRSCSDGRLPGPNRDGMLFQISRVRIADVTDGTSQTLFVGEMTGAWGINPDEGKVFLQVHWVTENLQDTALGINGPGSVPGGRNQTLDPLDGDGIGTRHHEMFREVGFSSFHSGGCHFLLVDGSVRILSENISAAVLSHLTTRSAGDTVAEF